MQTLKPIYDFDSYSVPIEKRIYSHLYAWIFAPLLDLLSPPETKENALGAVKQAIKSGKIIYNPPYFSGTFSAAISKELKEAGAVYNKTRKSFKIEQISLPLDIKVTIAEKNVQNKEKAKQIETVLMGMESAVPPPIDFEPLFGDTINKLNKQFDSSTKPLTGADVEIALDPAFKTVLKDAYSENLNLYVKDWYDEQILRLREKVYKNVEQGFRAENLVETIQAEKRVSYNKAKFLAKQETSLMVSKYRQARYEDVGIDKYRWSTSHDPRVRHDHAELQGKVFSFSNPPVTNQQTGARNNPGEDFGCRCVAIPILPSREVLRKELANA